MFSSLAVALLMAARVHAAGVVPTGPGPNQSYKAGGDCSLSWNLDTSGKWTSFSVDLMTGSNTAMQLVTHVFKDRDGTKGDSTHVWKCPDVSPYSAIYFYQFTQAGADPTWTTRFAISSPSGEVTPPANALQPSGAAIPWGTGRLAGAGADSSPANTSTVAPPASANTTALNTPPATALTPAANSTAGSLSTNTTAAGVNGSASTPTAPTQTIGTGTGTSSKAPVTPSHNTSPTSSGTSSPSSDAHSVSVSKNALAALAITAVLITA